jgi:epoxide hydrolase
VPTAVIAYAEDPSIRRFAERGNTIVRWTDIDDGATSLPSNNPTA